MPQILEVLTRFISDAPQYDENEPREPPPPATPLDFPCCEPSKLSVLEPEVSNDLVTLFGNTLRTGPTAKHLQALNISLANELPLEQVVPTDFTPHSSWLKDPVKFELAESTEASAALSKPHSLSNGAPAPGREDFFIRAKELLYENEDAFRAMQRKPPVAGRLPARIVHFRKFWVGLLLMAEHWDTSLDEYSDSKEMDYKSGKDIDELQSKAPKLSQRWKQTKVRI